MTAYLVANKPVRSQFRSPRGARPTGAIILHTAESILDSVGPDTGAENVARYMTTRTTPGSYHDLADSDSVVHLVPYEYEAWQDGTGSNPWALSISWALAAADWPRLTPARRDAFLRQGALAFHRQQAWLRANHLPITPLRRITAAQSAAGWAGFVTHGDRDPGRRSDPGAAFPWARWFELCADPSVTPEEDPLSALTDDQQRDLLKRVEQMSALLDYALVPAAGEGATPGSHGKGELTHLIRETRLAVLGRGDLDAAAIAAAIPAGLARQVADELAARLTKETS